MIYKKKQILDFISSFDKFINENDGYLSSGKLSKKVYHTSGTEINSLGITPMWFALEKNHSDDGWFQNMLDDTGEAYQYEAQISGKIADLEDPEVAELFKEIEEDPRDWEIEIVSNPTSEQVMELEGTKALIDAGYAGVIYTDYDPRDWDYDLEALIVFNPLRDVKNFRLVRKKTT